MSDAVLVQIITTVGAVVLALLGNRKLNTIRDDAREARNQTANSHGTNLRDDVDRIESKVDGLRKEIRDLHDEDADLEHTWSKRQVSARRALDAAIDERNSRIDRLREEVPAIVRHEISTHVIDCPLRTDTKGD